MTAYFQFYNNGSIDDFDDVFVRKELFSQKGLWVWGGQGASAGALGDNTTTNRSSPIQTVSGGTNWKMASGGYYSSAGIKTDGTLWTWGSNTNYQLGDNTGTSKSSPVQTVAGGTNWVTVSISASNGNAIKSDGTLWTWGAQIGLGDGSITHKSSPVQTTAGGTNWVMCAAGNNVGAGIKTDGSLWIWGNNSLGQLGTNNRTNTSTPVQTVAAGTNWKFVATVKENGISAGLKTDGTLWLWGRNNYGQLGDGTTLNRSSPQQTVAGGTNWKHISISAGHTAGIKTDGTLWNWGLNHVGQLGNNAGGANTNKSSPVQTVAGGTNWKYLSQGFSNGYGIKTDGTLWCWGYGTTGSLGDNTQVSKSSPVQTVAGGTNWKNFCNGTLRFGTFVIRSDI